MSSRARTFRFSTCSSLQVSVDDGAHHRRERFERGAGSSPTSTLQPTAYSYDRPDRHHRSRTAGRHGGDGAGGRPRHRTNRKRRVGLGVHRAKTACSPMRRSSRPLPAAVEIWKFRFSSSIPCRGDHANRCSMTMIVAMKLNWSPRARRDSERSGGALLSASPSEPNRIDAKRAPYLGARPGLRRHHRVTSIPSKSSTLLRRRGLHRLRGGAVAGRHTPEPDALFRSADVAPGARPLAARGDSTGTAFRGRRCSPRNQALAGAAPE